MKKELQSKDLRIGNLVNFAEDGVIFEVVGVSNDGLYVKSSEEETYIEMELFEPIPLTEEWLLKFGFEKEGDSVFSIDRFIVFKNLYNIVVGLNASDFYISTGLGFQKHLEYIHQLQNIYFALTDEELELKSETP